MPEFDLVIKGGTVYNGSGAQPFKADIAVKGGIICNVGSVPQGQTKGEIDATGMAVSPGFIDVHAHSEFTLLADPRAEGKVSQGVTTEISGNCGLSAGPMLGEALRQRQADLEELGITHRWNTLGEYLSILEGQGLAFNFATLAGHGSIRASVMGYASRSPEKAEMEKMNALLADAIDDGALGLSTGLIYPPGVYSTASEIAGLSSFGKKHKEGFLYASHIRSEGDRLIEAIEEAIAIGRASGARVQISHIKTAGKRNWHKADKAISIIDDARVEGVAVTCDRYPYTAASTDLDSVLPKSALEGGNKAVLARLMDGSTRKEIEGELKSQDTDWGSIVVSSVSTTENTSVEGLSIKAISERMGKEPHVALVDILIMDKLRTGAIFHSMSYENMKKFLSLPYVMIGSDSSARSTDGPTRRGKPHPRGFGSFAKMLRLAREGLMPLAEAVRKMTSLPAETFGLSGRGLIKESYSADIVVFDPAGVADTADFEKPFELSRGIKDVIVNGVPVVKNFEFTGGRPGRALRGGK